MTLISDEKLEIRLTLSLKLVPLDRIELPCSDYKTDIIPLYEKGLKFGELYEDRTHTSGITTRGADHYTNNSIEI